ncbi:MAG: ABC transporter substrate-binding protein [Raoultibacter sp.]
MKPSQKESLKYTEENQVLASREKNAEPCVSKVSSFSRRCFLELAGIAAATMALSPALFGCASGVSGSDKTTASAEVDYANWDAVLAAAKGQSVSWYGYGGSEDRNTWIKETLAPALKENYDITLDLVGMNINDILTQLSGEMQAGVESGSIDFIWINGENFFSTKENGYLFGPFTENLPNFKKYINVESPEVAYDFGSPTEGFESPYGKAQMQMWVDSARITEMPKNPGEFKAFCAAHQGQVTYPEPGDFTGTAFISCLIAGVIGADEFEKLSRMEAPTAKEVKKIIDPGLDYLRQLNPYLWKAGTTFPADAATVSTMYADGELVMNMGYGAPESLVKNKTLPTTTRSFIFDTGTVGNSNFMAIAKNAPHKAAALVAINEVISPEMQLSQYENLTNISVLDMTKLSADQRKAFDAVSLGTTQLPLNDLLEHRVAEAAGPVIPLIEQLWLDEVIGK